MFAAIAKFEIKMLFMHDASGARRGWGEQGWFEMGSV
jgi:hypothetical protein